jgi:hydroxylamine dehydrogenase
MRTGSLKKLTIWRIDHQQKGGIMKKKSKHLKVVLGVLALSMIFAFNANAKISEQTQQCMECHKDIMPGIVDQWQDSNHWQAGVGCYECHAANEGDADAMDHNGFLVATIVSPKDCAKCHPKESAEQEASHHAKAGDILNTNDGLLGQTLGGEPAVAVGCRQCHGSLVKVMPGGKLDPSTWPNTGIGRVNPDGSKGTCSACHTRHRFSKEQARQPEVCGKCHLGPDHPQKEVYEESKHGILYHAFKDDMNMDKPKWVAGEDYYDAPTCSTCHISATPDLPVTHDVGTRLSWNLRAPVSKRTENWEKKLGDMKSVCNSCHGDVFVSGFYQQLDDLVDLYNTKFAIPARDIREMLMEKGVISKANFDDKIDWIWWELWHHEGRRARHGAAMSGPDYAWWHGIYDVAKHFYTEFMPEVEEACKKADQEKLYQDILDKYIKNDPRHAWFTEGFDPKKVEALRKYYKDRYGQKVD